MVKPISLRLSPAATKARESLIAAGRGDVFQRARNAHVLREARKTLERLKRETDHRQQVETASRSAQIAIAKAFLLRGKLGPPLNRDDRELHELVTTTMKRLSRWM